LLVYTESDVGRTGPIHRLMSQAIQRNYSLWHGPFFIFRWKPCGHEPNALFVLERVYLGNPVLSLNQNKHLEYFGIRHLTEVRIGDNFQALEGTSDAHARARSVKVNDMTANTVTEIIARNVKPDSRLMTDESPIYNRVGRTMDSHERVQHKRKEYARGDVTTNTVEGYFTRAEFRALCLLLRRLKDRRKKR